MYYVNILFPIPLPRKKEKKKKKRNKITTKIKLKDYSWSSIYHVRCVTVANGRESEWSERREITIGKNLRDTTYDEGIIYARVRPFGERP